MEMGTIHIELFVIQLIFVFLLLWIVSFFVKRHHAYQLEKRIGKYSVYDSSNQIISMTEKTTLFFYRMIKGFSCMMKKNKYIVCYAKKYNQLIPNIKKEKLEAIDIISMEIGIFMLFLFCTAIANLFLLQDFTMIQLFICLVASICVVQLSFLFIRKKSSFLFIYVKHLAIY